MRTRSARQVASKVIGPLLASKVIGLLLADDTRISLSSFRVKVEDVW